MSSKWYPHTMYALKQGYEALFRGFNIGVVCLSPRERFMLPKTKDKPHFQNPISDIFGGGRLSKTVLQKSKKTVCEK